MTYKNKKPAAAVYIGCPGGTLISAASLRLSGNRSKRGTAISTPKAKTAMIPNLFLNRAAINPPDRVDTKVTVLETMGRKFMYRRFLPRFLVSE
jgi:hypothetical protein